MEFSIDANELSCDEIPDALEANDDIAPNTFSDTLSFQLSA